MDGVDGHLAIAVTLEVLKHMPYFPAPEVPALLSTVQVQVLKELPSTNTVLADPHIAPPLEHSVPDDVQLADVIDVPTLQSHVVQALFVEASSPRGTPAVAQLANGSASPHAIPPVPIPLLLERVAEESVPFAPVCHSPLMCPVLLLLDALPAVVTDVGPAPIDMVTHESLLQLTEVVAEVLPHPRVTSATPDVDTAVLVALQLNGSVSEDPFAQRDYVLPDETGVAAAVLSLVALPVSRRSVSFECAGEPGMGT